LNVGLALLLVPRFGLLGAAWATMLAQVLATVLIAVIGNRFDPVRWDHARYALAFGGSLALTLSMGSLELGGMGLDIAARVSALALLSVLLGAVLWGRPLILAEALMRLLSRQPAAATALFAGAHRTRP
jgi:O-antigen/teichoic acid export membrane protein